MLFSRSLKLGFLGYEAAAQGPYSCSNLEPGEFGSHIQMFFVVYPIIFEVLLDVFFLNIDSPAFLEYVSQKPYFGEIQPNLDSDDVVIVMNSLLFIETSLRASHSAVFLVHSISHRPEFVDNIRPAIFFLDFEIIEFQFVRGIVCKDVFLQTHVPSDIFQSYSLPGQQGGKGSLTVSTTEHTLLFNMEQQCSFNVQIKPNSLSLHFIKFGWVYFRRQPVGAQN